MGKITRKSNGLTCKGACWSKEKCTRARDKSGNKVLRNRVGDRCGEQCCRARCRCKREGTGTERSMVYRTRGARHLSEKTSFFNKIASS